MEKIAENVYIEIEYDGVNVGAILTTQGIIAVAEYIPELLDMFPHHKC